MIRNFTKIILKNNIRIYLSDYSDIVNQILNFHNYTPLPNLILSNFIAAFGPLKFLYETDELLLKVKTNGAINSLYLEIKNDDIRALISNPNIETEYDKQNFNEIPLILGIGDDGIISVTKKIKNTFHTSETKLARADVVSDLAYYLNQSDQVFSAVQNDVQLDKKNPKVVSKAKNVIFQLLPEHTEEDIKWIENFIKNNKFNNYTLLEYEELIDGKLLEIKSINGGCWCDVKKVIKTIELLDKTEVDEMFIDGNIEIVCEFCEKKYKIKKGDLYE